MNFSLIFILSLFLGLPMLAQNFERINFNESPDDYYLAVPPASEDILGVILLMPGFGLDAESIFPQTKLHNVAYANKVLTIAVAGGPKIYADQAVINRLNQAIEHVKDRYKVTADSFIIGGFSAGGTISLRYAEYCYEHPGLTPVQPKAVFSVDSPVDLFHIWNYFDRELTRNFSPVGTNEANFVKGIMLDEIGDPEQEVEQYNQLTPFNATLKQPGNEKFLKDISVRVYHDIDVEWLVNNRRRSLYDNNALPASELINRLVQLGNSQAEFMQAKQPGIRSNGMRHPHSWSIVDEVELVQWALAHFE